MMPDTTAAIATDNGQPKTGITSPPQQAGVRIAATTAKLATVTRSKRRKNPEIVTRSNVLPEQDDERQSVTLGGFLFKRDGVGWECRDVVYIEDQATGKRARKRPYLAHLSRTNYEDLKAKNSTPTSLRDALIRWAEAKRKKKGR